MRRLSFAVMLGLLSVLAQQSLAQETVVGITRPSHEAAISFQRMGAVAEIPVKDGQAVTKGQLLIQLDDRLERKELENLEIEAPSTLQIEAAKKELEMRELTLARIEKMARDNVASRTELDEARVSRDIAAIAVQQKEQELRQKQIQRDQQEELLELMRLTSKFDGIVARIDVGLGQIVDPQKPAMIIVQNDPLWIEFTLPSAEAELLRDQTTMSVRYPNEPEWRNASVILRSPVVDAASDRQLVRLEMENPQLRPSGLQVEVKLPGAVADAAGSADQKSTGQSTVTSR